MSTFLLRALLAFFIALPLAGAAAALELKPFRDRLFAYPAVLESRDDGAYLVLDYQEMRDINERDETPERRVRSAWVAPGIRKHQVQETVVQDGRSIDVTRVGPETHAAFSVIFVHGRGGDRRLGVNDYTFGGNFNRIKNLAFENGGSYYSVSMKSFDGEGVEDIAALVKTIRLRSPGAPVVLSCASMGSLVCWGATRDKVTSAALSGMMVMGGISDPDFVRTAAFRRRLPMFFSHGSHDSVYSADDQERLYDSLHSKDYPVRFVLFRSGSHGTPVRMTDWRDALNWIFAHMPVR